MFGEFGYASTLSFMISTAVFVVAGLDEFVPDQVDRRFREQTWRWDLSYAPRQHGADLRGASRLIDHAERDHLRRRRECLFGRGRVSRRLDQRRHIPVGDLLHQFGMSLEHVGAMTAGSFMHPRLSWISGDVVIPLHGDDGAGKFIVIGGRKEFRRGRGVAQKLAALAVGGPESSTSECTSG